MHLTPSPQSIEAARLAMLADRAGVTRVTGVMFDADGHPISGWVMECPICNAPAAGVSESAVKVSIARHLESAHKAQGTAA